MSVKRHSITDCTGSQHRCTGCNEVKPVEMYYKNKDTPCGYDPRCKQCRHESRRARMGAKIEKPRSLTDQERKDRRAASVKKYTQARKHEISVANRIFKLKKNFNLTSDQYTWLLHLQKGKCFLCLEHESKIDSRTGWVMNLSIDHDHRCCREPGKSCGKCVRHLLCWHCNTLLGKIEMKPALLHRFSDYIDLRPLVGYPGEGNW